MPLNKSFFIIYSGNILNELKSKNIKNFFILNSHLAIINVSETFDCEMLRKLDSVVSIIESSSMSSLIELNDTSIENGETIKDASGIDYIEKNPYLNLKGKNILVAIIDSGIDYLNKDFIDDDNKTKILSIWDQQKVSDKVYDNVPFGTEITEDEINEAILNNNPNLTTDTIGTGTIVSGIICGEGNIINDYRGIAPESKLIVVKLKEYNNRYLNTRKSYRDTDFLAGIRYVLDIAKRENKPLIINLTVGSISSEVNGMNLLDTFDELSNPGVFVVGGAGNQGNTGIHYLGKLESINDIKDIIIQVGEQNSLDVLMEVRSLDKLGVQIISPSGELSYIANYTPENIVFSGSFNSENTKYRIYYSYPDLLLARQKVIVNLKDIKPGVWTLRVTPEFLVNGEFNLYLPNKNLLSEETKFVNSDSISTITTYSAGKNTITVGVFNDRTSSMWLGSSQGSTFGDFLKPDIVASGVDIISTFINNTYKVSTGSGISSSIATGVVALIIEYLIEQSKFTRLTLFPQVIKTYLMLGAEKKDIYKYPNISQGYGILNLENTIREIADNL